jgi:hypothetical protein
VWALVSRGMATLQELKSWTHSDVMRALAVLHMRDDVEAQRMEDEKDKRDADSP